MFSIDLQLCLVLTSSYGYDGEALDNKTGCPVRFAGSTTQGGFIFQNSRILPIYEAFIQRCQFPINTCTLKALSLQVWNRFFFLWFLYESDLRIISAGENICFFKTPLNQEKWQYRPYYWSDKGFKATWIG